MYILIYIYILFTLFDTSFVLYSFISETWPWTAEEIAKLADVAMSGKGVQIALLLCMHSKVQLEQLAHALAAIEA